MKRKVPCSTCPYKLGFVQTVVCPCPPCKANGYYMFEWLQKGSRKIPINLRGRR